MSVDKTWVIINFKKLKKKEKGALTVYGNLTILAEKENIIIKGKRISYNSLFNKTFKDRYFYNEDYFIVEKKVIKGSRRK